MSKHHDNQERQRRRAEIASKRSARRSPRVKVDPSPINEWINSISRKVAIRDAFSAYPSFGSVKDPLYNSIIKELQHESLKDDKKAQEHFKTLLKSFDADIEFLRKIAIRYDDWVRPFDTWKKRGKSKNAQIKSLINHLFCLYRPPSFFYSVWFKDEYKDDDIAKRWFINIGKGENIRKQDDLPVELTKKMAHHYMQCPNQYDCKKAFRWAQMRGIGATEYQTHAMLNIPQIDDTVLHNGSYASAKFRNNEILSSFFMFVVNNPMLDTHEYRNLLDYILHMYRNDRSYSLKGRTVASLMRNMEEWHDELNRVRIEKHGKKSWPHCEFEDYSWEEGKQYSITRYRVEEILSSRKLSEEGKAMRHCVYSYTRSCIARKCAIFSYQKTGINSVDFKRVSTIEVDLRSKKVVQIANKINKRPKKTELLKIKIWAKEVGLSMGMYD